MKRIIAYPRISRRIQAVLIDSVILSIGAISTLIIMAKFGVQGVPSVILAIQVVFVLEPALVAYTGGTLGHHILGLAVVSKKSLNNIGIISAIKRFIAKIILGIFSIVSIFTTRQYQAVHDLLVDSIVVVKNPQTVRSHEALAEREVEESGYSYPSKTRRIIMIILYNLALYYVMELLLTFFVSDKCSNNMRCAGLEAFIAYSLSILWIVGLFASIILCWRGLLFGCQRKLIAID